MATDLEDLPVKTEKPQGSAHFKIVPEKRQVRDQIRAEARRFGATFDRSTPLAKPALQKMGEELLKRMNLDEMFLGFTMVCLSNEFWREQLQAVDFKRRLLLMPHCLKHAEGCPADYDEFGLDCRKCGACSIADFKVKAEDLGYKVLVSEGTPIVLKIIISGHVDAIVGVACLNVLEKALDKVLLAGVPCLAVPLLSSNCRSTSVDADWVAEMIDLRTEPPAAKTKTYLHLMRSAHEVCEEPELGRLFPRTRGKSSGEKGMTGSIDPLALNEEIAYDWVSRGGKHFRPFITLAAYDALTGGKCLHGMESGALPDPVRRTALAMEVFHKASLVHDDIVDDDTFRYGRETLHRQYGLAPALNAGDYLIGMGYRLISRDRKELGGDCAADLLNRLAEAHQKLSEGQGAELLWREQSEKTLSPLEALKIYALKTSPAFEASLYAGVRLAGPADAYEKMIVEFSRHLGVAFQILNDLKDWDGDEDNKLLSCQDLLAGRPTLLLALALEGSKGAAHEELLSILHQDQGPENREKTPMPAPKVQRLRELFDQAQVFVKAQKLVDKYRARAEAIADEVQPSELRELLYYLVDSVLERRLEPAAAPQQVPLIQLSM